MVLQFSGTSNSATRGFFKSVCIIETPYFMSFIPIEVSTTQKLYWALKWLLKLWKVYVHVLMISALGWKIRDLKCPSLI